VSLPVKVSEAQFTRQVIQLARLLGWRVAHFRPAMTKHGWRTPVQGDGAGFPDLILVRGPVCLAVELKAVDGKLRPEQKVWLEAFQTAGIESMVWTPNNWDVIEKRLKPANMQVVRAGQ
jgi:hypothetical protein